MSRFGFAGDPGVAPGRCPATPAGGSSPAHAAPGRARDADPEPGRQPLLITPHLRSLIDPADPADPIARQFLPSILEQSVSPGECQDPLDERRVEAVPRLLHRYPDRALLLVTHRCAAYCRFCFRREAAGRRHPSGDIRSGELHRAAAYVAAHPEIHELILSGGDPLVLADARLGVVLRAFRGAGAACPGAEPPQSAGPAHARLILRLHTRLPVVSPRRVTPGLAGLLSSFQPLRIVLHVNHPRELVPECREALHRLGQSGLELLAHSVLLRGVNDDAGVLAELWRRLAAAGTRPYYLFQPDLARGTAHFRVDLEAALELYRAAAALAGPGGLVPRFALDLPGGLGKAVLPDCRVSRQGKDLYRIEAPDGRSALYPRDPPLGPRAALRRPGDEATVAGLRR